jgi:hypothetical protein
MNNYFNFKIPFFNYQFGSDWGSFNSIVDDNVDYLMQKTEDLYKIKDITMMPILATELSLNLRKIETNPEESIALKKLKLRKFSTNFKEKGTSKIYLDYAENIVGARGKLYNAYGLGGTRWGFSIWPNVGSPDPNDRVWATVTVAYQIYVDVKTTDPELLDAIVDVYRQSFLMPAFYKIFLVDSEFNILRSV